MILKPKAGEKKAESSPFQSGVIKLLKFRTSVGR